MMEKMVFVIEMKEPVHPSFDAKTFARGIAYRASRWCKEVAVKGENAQITMKSEKEE